MKIRRRCALATLIVLPFSACGCQRSVQYRIIDASGLDFASLDEVVKGVQLTVDAYCPSTDSQLGGPILYVKNYSDKEVAVENGQLETLGRTIDARPLDREFRTVAAWTSKTVRLVWEFGDRAEDALGFDVTWIWQIQIGEAKHSLRILMRQVTR